MNETLLEQLIKVYNTLLLVNTRGEDTVVMGQCLSSFKNVLLELQNNLSNPIQPDENE